jgi:hypothetical protein
MDTLIHEKLQVTELNFMRKYIDQIWKINKELFLKLAGFFARFLGRFSLFLMQFACQETII